MKLFTGLEYLVILEMPQITREVHCLTLQTHKQVTLYRKPCCRILEKFMFILNYCVGILTEKSFSYTSTPIQINR